MRAFIHSLLLIACACMSNAVEPEAARIDGVPALGAVAPSTSVSTGSAQPTTLGIVQGVAVVGTNRGVLRATLLGDNTLSPVPVVASAGEPTATGATTSIGRRGESGWFVVGESGLFLNAPTGLVPSPFSAALSGKRIHSLDVTGTGASEALWLSGADGAFVRRKDALVALAVSSGKMEAAVGLDDHRALLFGSGNAWEADVDTNALARVATGVAAVRGFDRDTDGTVYVATDAGLLVRAPKGDLRVRTFSAEGQPPRAVSAVSVGLGGVAVIVGTDVVVVDDRGPTVVGTLGVTGSKLAFDANGDLWVVAGGALSRLAAGKPASFERDVKPFMTQRCQGCHGSGAGGAPARAFDAYEAAKAAAPEILKRLRAENRPVMPPPSMGVLSPADYRVVVRWALTGTPP